MPVGMTLQQLYSQPAYHGDVTSAASAAIPSTSSAASSTTATAKRSNMSAHGSASSSQQPEREYAQRTHENAYPPEPRAPYQDSHASMQHYQPPLPPPHAYAQYPPKQQSVGNQHQHGSDEYGLADPLPFEYMGMRKYPDLTKDQTTDHRFAQPMGGAYQGSYGAQSSHPPVYENQHHAHPAKSIEDRGYHQQQYTHHVADRNVVYNNGPDAATAGHFPHAPYPNMPPHLYAAPHGGAPMSSLPPQHSFPPIIDTQNLKKETSGGASDPQQQQQQYSPHGPVEYSSSPVAQAQSAGQEAVIKVKTPLKTKYWRNGRRNLQCFPSCKVFGDYSSIKIEDLKQHDFMWGKCRGSLISEVTLNSSVSFDDILLLARVHSMENVPVAFEEAVIRECMLGRMVEPDVMDTMKDIWITGERLPDFVQQDGNTACYEFKPKVWKYQEDMTQGKCKRRNVKYYVQFEAFVLVMSGERRYYACIGSGMSTAFEVGSSRVLARQKRKAATGLDANPLYLKQGQGMDSPSELSGGGGPGGPGGPGAMGNPHSMMAPHPMMQQHNMHPQMFAPQNFAPQGGYPPVRGLPPAMNPSMMGGHMQQQHHGDNSGLQLHYHQPPHQQQQHQQQPPMQSHGPPPPPAASQKRKAPASHGSERGPKAKKVSNP